MIGERRKITILFASSTLARTNCLAALLAGRVPQRRSASKTRFFQRNRTNIPPLAPLALLALPEVIELLQDCLDHPRRPRPDAPPDIPAPVRLRPQSGSRQIPRAEVHRPR